MSKFIKHDWDDVSSMKHVTIDNRTTNLIHLSCGSYRYNFSKFSDWTEAALADYEENPCDDQIRQSISIVYSDENDVEEIFKWFKEKYIKNEK